MQADDLLGINVNGEFFPTSEFVSLGTELIESNHWPENFLTGVVATKDDQDDTVEDKGHALSHLYWRVHHKSNWLKRSSDFLMLHMRLCLSLRLIQICGLA